ncbi:MAG: 2,3-diphosphoglycerate-dependent phosphoglycerate mutase [Micropruina sp.]|uniref:2,3-bisphosphoglycerate-dependent phosphoglycerate mutase n=1 Tax=Micropruina sp. TaxID=2737536 RepID=UPI0039E3CF7F
MAAAFVNPRSAPDPAAGRLVLLRHGESSYNAEGRFTGLLDVPLTERGRAEARHAARLLADADIVPDLIYTSRLTRTRDTAQLVRDTLARPGIPTRAVWQLDERNYGALTGLSKADVLARYGPELFIRWRRTLTGQPPPMDEELIRQLREQPALAGLPARAVTATESLDDVRGRVGGLWHAQLDGELRRGGTVLVIAHGNSIRALCVVLDRLTEPEVIALNIPTGHPLVYDFDHRMHPVPRGGRYLDPDAARAAAKKVADAGGT